MPKNTEEDKNQQGFELLDPSKCSVSYRSRNELLIGTDFESISNGEVKDSMTDSGCKLTTVQFYTILKKTL